VPHLPMSVFDVRFPLAGVAEQPGVIRGYVRPERAATLTMDVEAPAGIDPASAVAWVDGRAVSHTIAAGLVRFTLDAKAATAADWAITGPGTETLGTGTPPLPGTAPRPTGATAAALAVACALTAAGWSRRRRARERRQADTTAGDQSTG
jgi:hypothetical protein